MGLSSERGYRYAALFISTRACFNFSTPTLQLALRRAGDPGPLPRLGAAELLHLTVHASTLPLQRLLFGSLNFGILYPPL